MAKVYAVFFLVLWALLLCASCARHVPEQSRQGISRYAVVQEKTIHYVETGSGTPIILIPGLFSTYRTWDRLVPLLQTDYRLFAIDNFGTGDSGRAAENFTYSVSEQADVIVAMMDHLHITRCNLVGVSYGGMIALNIAARYPNRVVTVTSIEGGVIMPKGSPYWMLENGLACPVIGDTIIGLLRLGLFDATMTQDIMGSAWSDMGEQEQEELVDIVSHNVQAASRPSWLGLARALNNAPDFSEEAKAITAPVLYLSGDKSSFRAMTEMNIAYFKQSLPNVRMVSFADGVHDLELQKPKETAALIQEFIGQHPMRGQERISSIPHRDSEPSESGVD